MAHEPMDSQIGSNKRDFQVYRRVSIQNLKTFPQTRGVALEDLDITDLQESVRENGIHQPLLVCEIDGEPGTWAVICGHRRLKAAMACRLAQVPVLIRKDVVYGQESFRQQIDTIQIEENLQRQDLNAAQEARAIQQYKTRHKLNNVQLARKLGIPRPTVQDSLRISNFVNALMGANHLAPQSGADPKGGAKYLAPQSRSDAKEGANHLAPQSRSDAKEGANHLAPQSGADPNGGAKYLAPQSGTDPKEGANHLAPHSRSDAEEGANHLAPHSRSDAEEGANHLAPPTLTQEQQKKLLTLPRFTLLLLAKTQKDVIFPKILKKVLSGEIAGNALFHLIERQNLRKKRQKSTGEKGVNPPIIQSFFQRGLKIYFKIQVAPNINRRLNKLSQLDVQREMEAFRTHFADLAEISLKNVLPTVPFSCRLALGSSDPNFGKKLLPSHPETESQKSDGVTEAERNDFKKIKSRPLTPLERDVCDRLNMILRGFNGNSFTPATMSRFLVAGIDLETIIAEYNLLIHRPETSPSAALYAHLLRRYLGRWEAPAKGYLNPIYFPKPQVAGDFQEQRTPVLALGDFQEKYDLLALNLKPGRNEGSPWEAILERCRKKMTPKDFEECFEGSRYCRVVGERLFIYFPNNLQPQIIQGEHHDVFYSCVPEDVEMCYLTPEILKWIETGR